MNRGTLALISAVSIMAGIGTWFLFPNPKTPEPANTSVSQPSASPSITSSPTPSASPSPEMQDALL